MVRQRKEKKAKDIKLRQPDRSAPSEKTLLEIAQDRNLFDMADKQERKNKKSKDEDSEEEKDEDEGEDLISPGAERIMEIALYAVCLAMLHYTLDYLVQHQYAMEMDHKLIISRAVQALFVFTALVWALHPHLANTTFIPGVPRRYHYAIRQAIFFATSLAAGCYLIHISNRYSYMAVMKQSPSIGCLWIWAVIEMDLSFSLLSLAGAYVYFWQGGYKL